MKNLRRILAEEGLVAAGSPAQEFKRKANGYAKRLARVIKKFSDRETDSRAESDGSIVWIKAGELDGRFEPGTIPGGKETGISVKFVFPDSRDKPGSEPYFKVSEINSTYKGCGSALMNELIKIALDVGITQGAHGWDLSGGFWSSYKGKHPEVKWLT